MAKRIVGIDFGTSTSVIRVKRYAKDGKPIGEKFETKEVMFSGMGATVPTLIMKNKDETVAYYGYEAQDKKKGFTNYWGFKVDLESEDAEKKARARKLTEEFFCYMEKQYRHQSEGGHLGDADDEVKTIVSYPVKWSEETREFMLSAARKAGFPNVSGKDEAQAAIQAVMVMSANYIKQNKLVESGKTANILLVDMGAGTTDLVLCSYTYGEKENVKIIDIWPKEGEILFGGKEVDVLLQNFFKDKMDADDAEKLLSRVGDDKFKSWKEETVSPALAKNDDVRDFGTLDDYADMLDIEVDEYCLDRKSFEACLKDYLEKLPVLINGCIENSNLNGSDIDLVIVTGGHSQWYFVHDIITGEMKKFGDVKLNKISEQKERFIPISRPHETVALGLAYDDIELAVEPIPAPTPTPGPTPKEDDDELFSRAVEMSSNGNSNGAFKILVQLAEQGYIKAYYRVADCYYFGTGTEKSLEKAKIWASKGAEAGDRFAKSLLERINRGDFPPTPGDKTDDELFNHALKIGRSGRVEEAYRIMLQLAEKGYVKAYYRVANCYYLGVGTEKSLEKAKYWANKGKIAGDKDAIKLWEDITKSQGSSGETANYSDERNFYINEDNGVCNIQYYMGHEKVVVIPPYIKGLKVVSIGGIRDASGAESGFSGNKSVEKVVIPDTLSVIGADSFYKCLNLKEVIAHPNITEIGFHAFFDCVKLEKLDFQLGCGYKKTCMPKGMKSLGAGFSYSMHTASTIFGSSVLTTEKIWDEITISQYTKHNRDTMGCKISYYPDDMEFSGESSPESDFDIKVLSNTTCAITKYKGVAKEVNIPSEIKGFKVVAIGIKSANVVEDFSQAFARNQHIEKVIIPDTVIEINRYAFYQCRNLKVVMAHPGIEFIGDTAFRECVNLARLDFQVGWDNKCVFFPKGLKEIGFDAFFCGVMFMGDVINKAHISRNTKVSTMIGMKSLRCNVLYYAN